MKRKHGRGFGYSTSEHQRMAEDWTDHVAFRIVDGANLLQKGQCESALYEFIAVERELGNMAGHMAGAHGGGDDLNRKFGQFEKQVRVGIRKAVACLMIASGSKGERE